MKKQFIEFLKSKGPTKKEINLSFTQCQDKNSESKKINDESKENPDNQSLGQIEVSFWKKISIRRAIRVVKIIRLFQRKAIISIKI